MFFKRPRPGVQPEWLIVGLGNPGGEYRGTRHNVGFELVDLLAEKHRVKLDKSKHRSRFGIGQIGDSHVLLMKPLTYMNLSGQAVAPLAREYSLKPDRILVLADDLDLPVGRLRIREKGSAGGHNGHKSLIGSLGTQEYPRLKIGIGASEKGQTVDHVLGTFKPDERTDIEKALKAAAQAVETMLSSGYIAALAVVDEHNKRMA